MAVTVTGPGDDNVLGAVYRPEFEIVPQVEFPPFKQFTDHVTPVFELPVTVSVNCCVAPIAREAVVGVRVTATTRGGWGLVDNLPLQPHTSSAKIVAMSDLERASRE